MFNKTDRELMPTAIPIANGREGFSLALSHWERRERSQKALRCWAPRLWPKSHSEQDQRLAGGQYLGFWLWAKQLLGGAESIIALSAVSHEPKLVQSADLMQRSVGLTPQLNLASDVFFVSAQHCLQDGSCDFCVLMYCHVPIQINDGHICICIYIYISLYILYIYMVPPPGILNVKGGGVAYIYIYMYYIELHAFPWLRIGMVGSAEEPGKPSQCVC